MTEISYRPAVLGDAAEIHALLLLLAPEIPLLLDTLEREEALYALVRNCARTGESWVATDSGTGRIVGCALAEPAQHGRHYAESEVLELRHAGVAPPHRNRGVFTGLIARLCGRAVPVVVDVPAHNRSGAGDRLRVLGFRAAGDGRHLRWEPGGGG